MYAFSVSSGKKLDTTTDGLQRVFRKIMSYQIIDFGVVFGHRGEEEQNEAFDSGNSEKQYPDSKHNKLPSEAVDIQLYVHGKPVWTRAQYVWFAGMVEIVSRDMGVVIRWGGNWDRDDEIITDQQLQDLMHFEEIL